MTTFTRRAILASILLAAAEPAAADDTKILLDHATAIRLDNAEAVSYTHLTLPTILRV